MSRALDLYWCLVRPHRALCRSPIYDLAQHKRIDIRADRVASKSLARVHLCPAILAPSEGLTQRKEKVSPLRPVVLYDRNHIFLSWPLPGALCLKCLSVADMPKQKRSGSSSSSDKSSSTSNSSKSRSSSSSSSSSSSGSASSSSGGSSSSASTPRHSPQKSSGRKAPAAHPDNARSVMSDARTWHCQLCAAASTHLLLLISICWQSPTTPLLLKRAVAYRGTDPQKAKPTKHSSPPPERRSSNHEASRRRDTDTRYRPAAAWP